MTRPYTGNSDAPASGKKEGLEKFVDLCQFFWKFSNLGTYSNRLMRSAPAGITPASPDYKKWVSVHATGRACDLGWADRQKALDFIGFLENNADALEIEEIHDYYYTGPSGQWGRGWRCNRNGVAGWKIYDANDNAGTPGGKWVHVEISPRMANDPNLVGETFKQVFEKINHDAKVREYLMSLAKEAEEKQKAEKKAESKPVKKKK